MGSALVSVAAATAVVGYDLFGDEWFQSMGEERVLTGIAVTGSAADGDTVIELFVDDVLVGEYINTDSDFPVLSEDLIELEDIYVPIYAKIRAVVQDAPATNPINVHIQWESV